jgi:SynChlorMet cassette protein ScmC
VFREQTYSVRLSSGRCWQLQGSGATAGWIERFASHLGVGPGEEFHSSTITVVNPSDGKRREAGFPAGSEGPSLAQGWRRQWLPGLDLYRREGSHRVVCMLRDAASPDCEVEQMRYALYPILEGAVRDGGLPLHAALIERDGRGILIAAASGVGKSTCCRRFPFSWRVLADDMCLVVPAADGDWRAHPLPTWSAIKAGATTWSCRINESVPVSALFFLVRSEADGVKPLGQGSSALGIADGAAVCFSYLDRYFGAKADRLLRKRIFENAAALAGTLPAYTLRASLTGLFWEEIEKIPASDRTWAGHSPSITCRVLPG